MTKFMTQFMVQDRTVSNHGDRIHKLYSPVFDKDGIMHLEEAGTEDIYDMIQSHKDSVDIHLILKRYSAGDFAALSRAQGMYGDFTQAPKTFAEALNALIGAENYFISLPVKEREKYGHSFERWLAECDRQLQGEDGSSPAKQPKTVEPAPAAGDEVVKESAK